MSKSFKQTEALRYLASKIEPNKEYRIKDLVTLLMESPMRFKNATAAAFMTKARMDGYFTKKGASKFAPVEMGKATHDMLTRSKSVDSAKKEPLIEKADHSKEKSSDDNKRIENPKMPSFTEITHTLFEKHQTEFCYRNQLFTTIANKYHVITQKYLRDYLDQAEELGLIERSPSGRIQFVETKVVPFLSERVEGYVNERASQEELKRTRVQNFVTYLVAYLDGKPEDRDKVYKILSAHDLSMTREKYAKFLEEAIMMDKINLRDSGRIVEFVGHDKFVSPEEGTNLFREKTRVSVEENFLEHLQEMFLEMESANMTILKMIEFFNGKMSTVDVHRFKDKLLKLDLIEPFSNNVLRFNKQRTLQYLAESRGESVPETISEESQFRIFAKVMNSVLPENEEQYSTLITTKIKYDHLHNVVGLTDQEIAEFKSMSIKLGVARNIETGAIKLDVRTLRGALHDYGFVRTIAFAEEYPNLNNFLKRDYAPKPTHYKEQNVTVSAPKPIKKPSPKPADYVKETTQKKPIVEEHQKQDDDFGIDFTSISKEVEPIPTIEHKEEVVMTEQIAVTPNTIDEGMKQVNECLDKAIDLVNNIPLQAFETVESFAHAKKTVALLNQAKAGK